MERGVEKEKEDELVDPDKGIFCCSIHKEPFVTTSRKEFNEHLRDHYKHIWGSIDEGRKRRSEKTLKPEKSKAGRDLKLE